MKTKNRIWICHLLVIGLVLILANNCKKDNNNNPAAIITDIDGNVYTSVAIGTQVWMTENLKTTKFRNGDLIGTTTPDTLDISGENEPKYQWAYDGNESLVTTYGRLYTWYAATDTRNVCPTGWHVPTDAEWTTLTTFLGGDSVAGGKLKETGTTHWSTPNKGATNETGFTALAAGNRWYWSDATFWGIGYAAMWWSSIGNSSDYAYFRSMSYDGNSVTRNLPQKDFGFSVRCLKD